LPPERAHGAREIEQLRAKARPGFGVPLGMNGDAGSCVMGIPPNYDMFSIAAKTGQRQLPAFETQTFTGQLEFTHNARIESVERVRATRGRKAVTQIGGPATPAELVLRFEQQNPFARFPKISGGGETAGVTANHDRVVGVIRTHLRRPALR